MNAEWVLEYKYSATATRASWLPTMLRAWARYIARNSRLRRVSRNVIRPGACVSLMAFLVVCGAPLSHRWPTDRRIGTVRPGKDPDVALAKTPNILVVGGGYVGMYTALRLKRRLRRGEATITVVDPQSYMTYQPFLPESAAGNLEPRHVVVPLRKVLEGCEILTGRITSIDHAAPDRPVRAVGGRRRDLRYDVLVLAPGSIARTLPIPGLAEHGIGFRDRRRGDLPAQPGACPPRSRRIDRRRARSVAGR